MGDPIANRAAPLVAAQTAVRRIAPYNSGYGEPLRRFFKEWVAAARPADLHIELITHRPGGRPLLSYHESLVGTWDSEILEASKYFLAEPPSGGTLHLYLAWVDGKARVTLQGAKNHLGKPWTKSQLRKAASERDHGYLVSDTDVWRNPYYVGRLRSLVWSGNPTLWRHCIGDSAGPARLAWEALSGSCPWEWRFKLKDIEDWYIADTMESNPASVLDQSRRRLIRKVLAHASKIYPRYHVFPAEIPAKVMRNRMKWNGGRGGATPMQALAYYLIEDPQGPGMPQTHAAKMLGCDDWRSVRHALDAFLEANPDAPRWPSPHRDWGPRIRLGEDQTMSHH